MDRREFYFNQELTKDDLNDAFDLVSNGLDARLSDIMTDGVVSGCAISTTTVSGWNVTITAGKIAKLGKHISFSGGSFDISHDFAGASTLPSAGNYRWVTVAIRYGQLLASSVTDGLGVTVYQHRTDSYNLNGTTLLADATATTNNAGDAKLYVIAGTQGATGTSIALSGLPSDAVILGDFLITNGQSHPDFTGGAVYHGRRAISKRVSQSGNVFPGDVAISRFDYQLIWEIEGHSIKTRFYQNNFGMIITSNAAWTPETTTTVVPTAPTGVWTADNTGYPATKYTLFDGVIAERKNQADTGTPWTDAAQSTAGWDSYAELGRGTTQSTYMAMNGNGDTVGKGVQNGYISALAAASSLALVWNTIQFPRAFSSTPSSVTLGSPGPNEANVASIVTGNLSVYGCDVRAAYTSPAASCVFQRPYIATQ